eukprot:9889557-Lingulodinium_polyedra.AAC.1
MERRPIWFLPVLYRVWAAGRAADVARWASAWGGPANRGVADLAWAFAVELEGAEAAGEAVAGAALDWRKAFDR